MIEPAMRPLGFDWKMSVALLSALPAKEIVVSTMGVIYQVEEADESSTSSLIKKLQEDRYPSGERRGELVFTKPAALSFLVFVLVYFPCVAVVAALKKESGSWRWAFFTIGYTTALAWIVAFVVFNLAKLFV
jgi:ferrous iron transport protein B